MKEKVRRALEDPRYKCAVAPHYQSGSWMERKDIVLNKKYQSLMNWAYWFREYNVRNAHGFLFGDPKRGSDILKEVLTGEPLYVPRSVLDDISPSILRRILETPEYEKKKSPTLLQQLYQQLSIDGELSEYEMEIINRDHYTFDIVNLNLSRPLDEVLEEIEIVWLENNGRELEAVLKRLYILFGKGIKWAGTPLKRAIGLLLWEYEQETGMKTSEAIAEIQAEYSSESRITSIESAEMYFFLRKTKESIENINVQSWTKKATTKNEQEKVEL